MKVNRELLLKALESVRPGLAAREMIEQSSCVVFDDGRLRTFNDEISCSVESPVKISGAVPADPLTALLGKMAESEVQLECDNGELRIQGKRRRGGIAMEAEVVLPAVDLPDEWKTLPEKFVPAIDVVRQCTSSDDNEFILTCVHISPDFVEACDNFQVTRYPLETGISDALVRGEALKYVVGLDMTEVGETESWLHFRNSSGLVLSCRRYVEDYPDWDSVLGCEGDKFVLPEALSEAVEKAAIFSGDNMEGNQVQVELRAGKLKVRGEGVRGWFEEMREAKYDGEPIRFRVAPALMKEITAKVSDCLISPTRLKVESEDFTFVACLGAVE